MIGTSFFTFSFVSFISIPDSNKNRNKDELKSLTSLSVISFANGNIKLLAYLQTGQPNLTHLGKF